MIEFLDGDLFKSNCDAYVNTVNTVGVMGKGIALEFKNRYPNNFKLYKDACDKNFVRVGTMFVTENAGFIPKWIFNFPTKRHWKEPSRLSFIEMGMRDLKYCIDTFKVESIAIPALGCSNGGLEWDIVKDIIVRHMKPFENKIDIKIYNPKN